MSGLSGMNLFIYCALYYLNVRTIPLCCVDMESSPICKLVNRNGTVPLEGREFTDLVMLSWLDMIGQQNIKRV